MINGVSNVFFPMQYLIRIGILHGATWGFGEMNCHRSLPHGPGQFYDLLALSM